MHISVGVESAVGQRVATWSTTYAGGDFSTAPAGEFRVRIHLPRTALMPGAYQLLPLRDRERRRLPTGCCRRARSTSTPGDFYGSGQLPGTRDGTFLSEHSIELLG